MTLTENVRERLMVTADDYGIRSTVEPILRLARAGAVDRVAVMTSYVTEAEARELIATGVKIDLHLELIHLLGRGDRLGDGTLTRLISFCGRLLSGALSQQAVLASWQEQIDRFHTIFGRLPDGLNSHEHVHYFPPFFRALVRLARQNNIAYVRFGKRGILLPARRSSIGLFLQPLARFSRRRFFRSGLTTSDYLVDLSWVKSFDHLLESFPQCGTVELIVHPEQTDEAMFVFKTLSPKGKQAA